MASPDAVYVRLSLVKPKPGSEGQVAKIEEDLMNFFTTQAGYLHGYHITRDNAGSERIGRMTVWRSEHDADTAAQTDHVLAIRSELRMLIDEDEHVEGSWLAHEHKAPA